MGKVGCSLLAAMRRDEAGMGDGGRDGIYECMLRGGIVGGS